MQIPIPARIITLTIEDMCAILHIKRNTMHNKKWQKKTGIPLHKVGKRLFCTSIDFNDWLADKKKLSL